MNLSVSNSINQVSMFQLLVLHCSRNMICLDCSGRRKMSPNCNTGLLVHPSSPSYRDFHRSWWNWRWRCKESWLVPNRIHKVVYSQLLSFLIHCLFFAFLQSELTTRIQLWIESIRLHHSLIFSSSALNTLFPSVKSLVDWINLSAKCFTKWIKYSPTSTTIVNCIWIDETICAFFRFKLCFMRLYKVSKHN